LLSPRRGVIIVRESQIWEEGGSVSAGEAASAGPCVTGRSLGSWRPAPVTEEQTDANKGPHHGR
jgi:hypothetical protein